MNQFLCVATGTRARCLLVLLFLAVGMVPAGAEVRSTESAAPGIELTGADAQGRYVHLVTFDEPGVLEQFRQERAPGQRFSPETPAVQSALAELQQSQAQRIAQLSAAIGRSLEASHHYLVTHSGIAIRLTLEEAARLAAQPGVAAVERERLYQLDTFRGPEFIGAGAIWDGTAVPGGSALLGEGMIAGILDTGILPGHPSFANDAAQCGHGQGGAPDKLISALDCATTDGTGLCNGPDPIDGHSHGSHVAGTVAGNFLDATASPPPPAPISGVAPCANIRAYKVCPSSCPAADIQAGMNSILLHGDVDVMNFSISGGTSPWTDNDRRKLDLVDAGIFVAASAGNTSASIPDPIGQVGHRGPWVATIANSSHDGMIANPLSLAGGPQDRAALQGTGPDLAATYVGDLRWAGDVDAANVEGCNAFPANAFNGEAALISRGSCNFSAKVNNAVTAGANFVVVYNNAPGAPIVMGGLESTTVSSVMVSQTDGSDLVTALGGGVAEVTVDVNTLVYSFPAQGDILSAGSLRGPTPSPLQDLQKPDITAPGTNILAPGTPASGYTFMSGTSMSSPHAAGSAVLVHQARPDWSPVEVKSALMMTAKNPGLKDDGVTPWDADDVGSGRVDLTKAAEAGLVMHEEFANFLAADPASGGDVKTLNLPALRNLDCTPSCSFTRTVRNTLGVASSWTVSSAFDTGSFNVTISPDNFSFTGVPSETQDLTVTISPQGSQTGTINFGSLTFSEGGGNSPDLHWTLAISGEEMAPPVAQVSPGALDFLVGENGSISENIQIANAGEADLTYLIEEGVRPTVVLDGKVISEPMPSGGPSGNIELRLDEGLAATTLVGLPDQEFLWFNRFTPDAVQLPFDLESVQVAFLQAGTPSEGAQVGDAFDVYVWSLPDGETVDNATLLASSTGNTIAALGSFQTIALGTPVPVDQATGDVLVGVVNRATRNPHFPAAADAGPSQERSWVAFNFPGGAAQDPPDLATPGAIDVIDSFVAGRNWLIRGIGTGGSGCLTPGDVTWLSVSPDNGVVAGSSSDSVSVDIDATGLAQGQYVADVCIQTNDPENPTLVVPVTLEVVAQADLPVVDVSTASVDLTAELGNTDSVVFDIANAGTGLDLDWTIDTAEPMGRAHDPSLDESFALGGFTLDSAANGGSPAVLTVPGGVASNGGVVGFSFEGTVAGISGTDSWAADMCMVVEAPDGTTYALGGFSGTLAGCNVNAWDFGGSGSTNDGTYASVHDGLWAEPGLEDDGDWTFTFVNDWDSASAATMDWSGVSVTLHKVAPPDVCDSPTAISWLTVNPTSGSNAAGTATSITVDADSAGLFAGTYEATLCIDSNDPATPRVRLPVSFEVTQSPTTAIIQGDILSTGYCQAALDPAVDASVTVEGALGAVVTVPVDGSGFYSVQMDESESPVSVSASAPDHIAEQVGGIVIAGQTVSQVDFELDLDSPCATVDPVEISAQMGAGNSTLVPVTIANVSGAAALDWSVFTAETAGSRDHFPATPFESGSVDASGGSWTADPEAGSSGTAFPAALPQGAAVPAYTTTGFTADGYVSLDATVPGTLNLINAAQPTNVFAATFLDNDFSVQYMLATEGGDLAGDTFGTIDTTTGGFTALGTVTGAVAGTWTSMKWDHTSDTLYAMKVVAGGDNRLYSIDPDTLVATEVGPVDGAGVDPGAIVIGIAISPEGLMFGLDIIADVLLAIDKETGDASVIGPTGIDANFAQDMDFDPLTGTLYWAGYLGGGNSQMFTVDPATGAATSIGNIGGGNELLSFSIALPRPVSCMEPAAISWLSFDLASGTAAPGDTSEIQAIIDSTGLGNGTYSADLCIETNDAETPLMVVPVTLDVVVDAIFSDRFEN